MSEESVPEALASKQTKNIVLCSDGTGNRGGKGNETNVWRIHNAVDIRCGSPEQVAYYDDGVGTQDFKYLKALSGATGLGFSRNVRQMYKFLIHTYNPKKDNQIYLFGFSRGAFTVRAFAAFALTCGLMNPADYDTDAELERKIKELVRDYHKWWRKNRKLPQEEKKAFATTINTTPLAEIEFIGVWDTVSAVGVPFEFGFSRLIRWLFVFYFSSRDLTKKVNGARQALALDDERKSFHPIVWNETKEGQSADSQREGLWSPRIKQVWFAGMHSNVGGGYPKQGLSYETLDWMLKELADHQKVDDKTLHFESGFTDDVHKHADVFDKLYDSRSGVAAYYRYKPRDVGRFCRDNGIPTADVHESVFARIAQKGRAYQPGNLPTDLDIRNVPNPSSFVDKANARKDERAVDISHASFWIRARTALYLAMVLLTLLVVTVILDEMVNNAVAFLVCVVLVVVVISLTERLAQQLVHARVPIYIVGLLTVAGLGWLVWTKLPLPVWEPFTFPVLLLVIIASIGYRHVSKLQHLAGTTEKSQYRRWESGFVCLFWSVVTVWLNATILHGEHSVDAVGKAIADFLLPVLGLVTSILPESAEKSVETAVGNYPYWSVAALIGGLLIVLGMKFCKEKAVQFFAASWDVVRD